MLGLTQDAVLITGDIFGTSSFKGPSVFAIPKADLYNGLGFSGPAFTPGTSVGTIAPPVLQDDRANAYFLATNSSGTSINLYRGTNLSNESQASYVLQAQISTAYSVPPSAVQPGSTQTLDTLDGRFQQASSQSAARCGRCTPPRSRVPGPVLLSDQHRHQRDHPVRLLL